MNPGNPFGNNPFGFNPFPGAPPGRGKTGGGDTIGPNDPIFHHPMGKKDEDRDITSLPRGGRPPGASYDPLTPFDIEPAGPNRDEPHPSGTH